MSNAAETKTFLQSPLVAWALSVDEESADPIRSIDGDDNEINCNELTPEQHASNIIFDERFLSRVWLHIEASSAFKTRFASKCQNKLIFEELKSIPAHERLDRLAALIEDLNDYYSKALGQTLVLRLPDPISLSSINTDEGIDALCLDELHRLLLLLLGSAVQCENKQVFVSGIQKLPEQVQIDITDLIREILDNAEAVWLKKEWAELETQLPIDEQKRMYALAVGNIDKLAQERDNLFKRLVQIKLELLHQQSKAALKEEYTSQTNSLVETANSALNDKMVELAHVSSKLRRAERDIEEKNEMIRELEACVEQSKASYTELSSQNLKLQQEARASKALQDEVDILQERVRRMDLLDTQTNQYKDKIKDLEFFKSRYEEIREEQRILSERKALLEEQLEEQCKKASKLPELEVQVLQFKAQVKELELQRDIDKDKCAGLLENLTQLRSEKKMVIEELENTRQELAHVRSQLNIYEHRKDNSGNLFDQINTDASKRMLKLELENQKLQSLVENAKNNKALKRYSIDCMPSTVLKGQFDEHEENLDGFLPNNGSCSPISSTLSDGGYASIAGDLNTRLEKIERENEKIHKALMSILEKQTEIETLNSNCSQLENDLKLARGLADNRAAQLDTTQKRLERELKQVKERAEQELSHVTRNLEETERRASKLNGDCQRLQSQVTTLKSRLDSQATEAASVEAENAKLQKANDHLRSQIEMLNRYERTSTQFEAESHRHQQELLCAKKEARRWRNELDEKDNRLYELSQKLTAFELENQSLKKETGDLTKQRDAARRRAERLAEYEGKILQMNEYSSELARQREQCRKLVEELSKAKADRMHYNRNQHYHAHNPHWHHHHYMMHLAQPALVSSNARHVHAALMDHENGQHNEPLIRSASTTDDEDSSQRSPTKGSVEIRELQTSSSTSPMSEVEQNAVWYEYGCL